MSTTSGLSAPELFLTLMAGDGLDANVIDAGVEKITCRQTDGERWLTLNNETGYAAVQNLDLYSRNAPFSNEKWLLVGTVRSSILFRFAHTVQQVITSAVLLTLLLGAVSSCWCPAVWPAPPSSSTASSGSQRQTDLPQVFAHRHPGAGPLCGGHHPAE